jgi:hypothetical protein
VTIPDAACFGADWSLSMECQSSLLKSAGVKAFSAEIGAGLDKGSSIHGVFLPRYKKAGMRLFMTRLVVSVIAMSLWNNLFG